MVGLGKKLLWLCGFVALVGCDDNAVNGPSADILSSPLDTTDDASLLADKDALADTGPDKAACQGTALDPAMAAFDYQCSFLQQCPHAGNCSCGDGCPASKTKCDAQFCSDPHPKCYCGGGCDAKLTQCPAYICGTTPPAGCDEHDDCVYNPQPPPTWCGCQQMPDHCSCGADCAPNVPLCDAKVCKTMPTKGCTANPTAYTNCYCQECGMLGQTPRCYFLLCPGAKP